MGDLLEFKNGLNASKEQYGKGIKFINVLDILSNDFITYDNIIGLVDIDDTTFDKYSVKYGDILFQRSSETREEVGTANVYLDKEKTATFGGFIIRGRKISDYEPIFLNKLLKTPAARKSITTKSGGSTRYNVGQDILTFISLHFPTLQEQQKIALFLSLLDERIQTQNQIIEELKLLKSTISRKLFSQQLRFRDDYGDNFCNWKLEKLGNVVKFLKGSNLSKNDIDLSGVLKCIHYGELFTIYNEVIYDIFSRTNKEGTRSQAGDILMPSSDVTPQGLATASTVLEENIILGGDINILRPKDTINSIFLSYFLNNAKRKIIELVSGTTVKHIYSKDLEQMDIPIPCFEEQCKIANFLSSFNRKIKIETIELQQLENQKKYLLSKLFI